MKKRKTCAIRRPYNLLGCRPIMYTNTLRKGSLGYLNHKAPMNKDNRSSLGSQEEFWVAVGFIFKEMKQMVFKDISIVFRNVGLFSCPIDDLWRYPIKNLKGCESFICYRDKRMIREGRQV